MIALTHKRIIAPVTLMLHLKVLLKQLGFRKACVTKITHATSFWSAPHLFLVQVRFLGYTSEMVLCSYIFLTAPFALMSRPFMNRQIFPGISSKRAVLTFKKIVSKYIRAHFYTIDIILHVI